MVDAVRAAGGEIYAVTSEPQYLADRAKEDWDLPFDCVGDPHHEIADAVRSRGWLDLYVQTNSDRIAKDTAWQVEHPKGFFQPGVLALTRSTRALYRWRSVPSRANTSGASGRPTATHVWQNIEQALAAGADEDVGHDPVDHNSTPAPFPVFALLLLANGWFIRPRLFTYQGDGKNPLKRIPRARLRLVGFIALWVVAFIALPLSIAAIALMAYVAGVAAPAIYGLYKTFTTET